MNARRHGRVLGTAVLAILIACGSAWAQATATISGTVRDQSGAVLPGVTVTVTQQETGLTRTTVSNETGSYVLPNLPLGPYRLEAMLQGLSVIYPSSMFADETMRSFRPEPRKKRGALTAACRSVLSCALCPLTVREICEKINDTSPERLFGHRMAMASVMSVLRNMERHREVVRGEENGKSVWHFRRERS